MGVAQVTTWKRFLGRLLCFTGRHLEPENTNKRWVPWWWCKRCFKKVDGGLAAQRRRFK